MLTFDNVFTLFLFNVDPGKLMYIFGRINLEMHKMFMKDLSDGFYPAEMQGDYPEGVSFLVSDKRFKLYGEGTYGNTERIAFWGKGRTLESRPASSTSASIKTLSPPKKKINFILKNLNTI